MCVDPVHIPISNMYSHVIGVWLSVTSGWMGGV